MKVLKSRLFHEHSGEIKICVASILRAACESGKEVCLFLKEEGIFSKLNLFLSCDVREKTSRRLTLEALRMWEICLRYYLLAPMLIDHIPVLIEKLEMMINKDSEYGMSVAASIIAILRRMMEIDDNIASMILPTVQHVLPLFFWKGTRRELSIDGALSLAESAKFLSIALGYISRKASLSISSLYSDYMLVFLRSHAFSKVVELLLTNYKSLPPASFEYKKGESKGLRPIVVIHNPKIRDARIMAFEELIIGVSTALYEFSMAKIEVGEEWFELLCSLLKLDWIKGRPTPFSQYLDAPRPKMLFYIVTLLLKSKVRKNKGIYKRITLFRTKYIYLTPGMPLSLFFHATEVERNISF